MGRMSHEQEALSRGAWYITDDRGNQQFLYKFVPDKRRDLSKGKLYGLKFDRADQDRRVGRPAGPDAPRGRHGRARRPADGRELVREGTRASSGRPDAATGVVLSRSRRVWAATRATSGSSPT